MVVNILQYGIGQEKADIGAGVQGMAQLGGRDVEGGLCQSGKVTGSLCKQVLGQHLVCCQPGLDLLADL